MQKLEDILKKQGIDIQNPIFEDLDLEFIQPQKKKSKRGKGSEIVDLNLPLPISTENTDLESSISDIIFLLNVGYFESLKERRFPARSLDELLLFGSLLLLKSVSRKFIKYLLTSLINIYLNSLMLPLYVQINDSLSSSVS